ncbi:DUF4374 domain-containing protein [Reichenbachiella sp. 5M10]|uniref:DUF4374 domain-containing protein n=1 Tax=Reichenbachiella sp. 5M10 TaxID=1889772 RepID=UPI00210149FC|nr:DUF4374 domain-containing protein [Reichenbachiella sp. 5M10]
MKRNYMNLINRARLLSLAIATLVSASILSSCDEGDDVSPAKGDFAVTLAIQGSEGGFTYYTVPFLDVMTGTLSAQNTEAIEQPGYYDYTQIDRTLYSIGGLGATDVHSIIQNEDESLSEVGSATFANSLSDLVRADDDNLLAVSLSSESDQVVFYTIDNNTISVKETFSSPASNLTTEYVAAYSGLAVSGDHVFLSYYISDRDTYNTPYTDKAQVAVYSYPELEFIKVIEDDRVGPLGGFNIKAGLFADEDGNIYGVSHSNPANGYSQSTKPAGILKINKGETEFDADYFFDVAALTDGKTISHLKYLGDGRAFAQINRDERAQQGRWSDSPLETAVVNLETPSVAFISDVPEHSGDGRRLAVLHNGDFVYQCIPEDTGIYVYKIDTKNLTAEKGALVEANFVAGFFRFD